MNEKKRKYHTCEIRRNGMLVSQRAYKTIADLRWIIKYDLKPGHKVEISTLPDN